VLANPTNTADSVTDSQTAIAAAGADNKGVAANENSTSVGVNDLLNGSDLSTDTDASTNLADSANTDASTNIADSGNGNDLSTNTDASTNLADSANTDASTNLADSANTDASTNLADSANTDASTNIADSGNGNDLSTNTDASTNLADSANTDASTNLTDSANTDASTNIADSGNGNDLSTDSSVDVADSFNTDNSTDLTLGNIGVAVASSSLSGTVTGASFSVAQGGSLSTGANTVDNSGFSNSAGITQANMNSGFHALSQQSVNVQANLTF
jgi:clumping factor A